MSFARAPEGWTLGVDSSTFQRTLDVPALKKVGCQFVIARATQGLHDVDGQFSKTLSSCVKNSMPVGAYGVLIPYTSDKAEAQAKHFLQVLGGYRLDLPAALDFELGKGATASDLLKAARIWCDIVEASTGRQVVVYTGPSFISGLARMAGKKGQADLEALATRPLWVAHYTQSFDKLPIVPEPWKSFCLWQASGDRHTCRNASQLPGQDLDVDVNLTRMGLDELLKLGMVR